MPLSFLTKSQQFVFVNSATQQLANPEDVTYPNTYDVSVVIENTDSVQYDNVQISVAHSAFGIGYQAGTQGLTQPAPINVPPEAYGIPGQATASFTFAVPQSGHGCLGATILPNGPSIGQNVTVQNAPIGTPSSHSFLVFSGPTAENMLLTLTETDQNGNTVAPGSAQSWSPLIVAPPGTGPAMPTPAPVTLSLAANDVYSAGLQVSIPSTATHPHTFTIIGTVGGVYEGEVSFVITPVTVGTYVAPDPYITGGYQSPDILLFDQSNNIIPIGGAPNGPTVLTLNTDYKLAAIIHNSSSVDAVNTTVRFWRIPGGNQNSGTLIDVVTADIPALSSVTVYSSFPFLSGDAALPHCCAAVSVYNAQSNAPGNIDYTSASQLPYSPEGAAGPTAWRNTEAIWVYIGRPWSLTVAVSEGVVNPGDPIEATVVKIPRDLEKVGEGARMAAAARALGNPHRYPLYYIPSIREKLPTVEMKISVAGIGEGRHVVEGHLPADASVGDMYLVTLRAKYKSKTVEFFSTLYVKAKEEARG